MINLTCFPITHDMLTVLQYKELMADYKIVAVNSFKEDIFIQKLKSKYPECTISADIYENLQESEGVLLLDNKEEYKWNKYQEILKIAKELNKKVIMSEELCAKMEVRTRENVELLQTQLPHKEKTKNEDLKSIEAPVIAVAGMGENCNKFESCLLVLKVLKERGYSVTFLSSNSLAMLFGGCIYPTYLYSENMSLEQKIWYLNQDIAEYIKKNETDVILAELPGGIMPLGENAKNHFSESAIAVTNAVKIDAGILNIYVPSYKNRDQFIYLKDYCDYKYEMQIEKIFMARQKVEYDQARHEYVYMYLDNVTYNKMWEKYCDENIIRFTKKEQAEKAVTEILHLLEENPEFI